MNKGVLQSSSPVQPMMAGGNPNWWWNLHGLRPPPPLPPPPAQPTLFSDGAPSNFFPDHLYVPSTTAPMVSASSSPPSSSSSSWQYLNNPELPEPLSQLLLRGLMDGNKDLKNDNKMNHMVQDHLQTSNGSSDHMDHLKQDNSMCNYNHKIYGHDPNYDHEQDYNRQRLGPAPKPSPIWSPMAHVSSPTGSCTTSMETNGVVAFSKIKSGTGHPPRNRAYECNSSGNGGAQKKARFHPSLAQSTFKVRKEKLGDRITALHQLVSPFGKTDTASVLLEAIGYIRFLQGQIEALSSPYLGKSSGKPGHHNSEEEDEELRNDLRSRGLCLVPISCTIEVGNESNVGADYWAASFEGGGIGFN